MAHINYAPEKLIRHGHDNWEFTPLQLGPSISPPTGLTGHTIVAQTQGSYPTDQHYVVTGIDDATGQESRASNAFLLQSDLTLRGNRNFIEWAASGASRYNIYRSDDQQNYGYIGTTTGTVFTDANIGPDLTDGPPEGYNPFPAAGDYPSTVSFHEQRLLFARTTNRPNAVWGSRAGDFENFDISHPLRDSDSYSFALVASRVNAVNQLVSTTSLLALTSNNLFSVTGTGNGDPITPTQIKPSRQTGRAASRLSPLLIDDVVFYTPAVGCSVRAINYSFQADGFQSNDLSIFSPHFFAGFTIVWWAYAQEPRSLVWAGRSDGALLCFTWEQEQQVWGWTICDLGGAAESGCVISEQGPDGRVEDRLYVTVRRTINGAEKVYIERMAAAAWDTVDDSCYLDCAVSYAFTEPATVLTGLDHLEGQTLTALADGNVMDGLMVVGGSVTLPNEASKVSIGLPYTALIETLPLSMQTQTGSSIARKASIGEAVIRVVNTRGLFAGPTESTQFEIKPRTNEDFGEPNALKTGDYLLDSAPVTEDGASYVVTAPYPLPATISAVLLEPVLTG